MFVVMSQFTVKNGMESAVSEAFRDRPHAVDSSSGFVKMEVMNPEETPEEFVLVTYWKDKLSYTTWYKQHSYQDSHRGIPKGLKLVPRATKIGFYNVLCH
jgi:heme oxygenase (mycobilin-producing)